MAFYGMHFTDCIVECNFGTAEIAATRIHGLFFKNLYVERDNATGNLIGLDLLALTGSIDGRQILAQSGTS